MLQGGRGQGKVFLEIKGMLNKRGLVTAGLCCCVSMLGWVRYTEASDKKERNKVEVCHKASGKFKELSVSESAVPAHLAHGDCLVDDGVRCTRDRCDRDLGCIHTPKNDRCDDERFCNGEETCDAVLGCLPGTPPCDDGVACTVDTCTENRDDDDDNTAKGGDDDDDDDNGGTCTYTPDNALCDDGSVCTVDICDPVLGCQYTATSTCGDGVVCAPEECDDGNTNAGDGCSPTCTVEGFCGDGVVTPPEECETDADCAADFFCNGCICTPEVSPECEGATCSTFIPCNPDSGCIQPVCATTPDQGGVCLEGATGCAGLLPCATSTDCPDGGACAVNTCCGALGVCVPASAFCRPGATATAQPAPVKTDGSTISQGSN